MQGEKAIVRAALHAGSWYTDSSKFSSIFRSTAG